MLSQIRQISDGNYNTVFVKNKEQKFNLDKEIHDLECWKQSRNHVYRKEERELLAHLGKLRHQQEYLHHLDGERGLHSRGSLESALTPPARHRRIRGSSHPNVSLASSLNGNDNTDGLALRSPSLSLPPVNDHKTLHRTEAHTNICVVCQLPRRSSIRHGHSSEELCSCEHEGTKEDPSVKARRFTVPAHGPPIQIGQRRHSLMMARLNDEKYEYRPHPPDQSHEGLHQKDQHHVRNVGVHVHSHPEHVHGHRGHAYDHHGHVHHHHDHHPRVHDHHGHHTPHDIHAEPRHPHHDIQHAPSNSSHRSSRHSFSHQGKHAPGTPSHDSSHSAHQSFMAGHGGHLDNHNGDARRRDHELHWDRHQVHKLRGMITDPHYKEQLEIEDGKVYPWSSQFPANKTSSDDFNDMKNCRYLRFSKLNLENMKDNPEKEVEVFERNDTPS